MPDKKVEIKHEKKKKKIFIVAKSRTRIRNDKGMIKKMLPGDKILSPDKTQLAGARNNSELTIVEEE